jgi:hypothetical protein
MDPKEVVKGGVKDEKNDVEPYKVPQDKAELDEEERIGDEARKRVGDANKEKLEKKAEEPVQAHAVEAKNKQDPDQAQQNEQIQQNNAKKKDQKQDDQTQGTDAQGQGCTNVQVLVTLVILVVVFIIGYAIFQQLNAPNPIVLADRISFVDTDDLHQTFWDDGGVIKHAYPDEDLIKTDANTDVSQPTESTYEYKWIPNGKL